MCMHSQGTDYTSVCMDAELSTCILLSAAIDRSGNEWVTGASLDVETLLVGSLRMQSSRHCFRWGSGRCSVAHLKYWCGLLLWR
jgi:hypothetical protein